MFFNMVICIGNFQIWSQQDDK